MVALAHLLALGVALLLYALPHHVLPSRQQSTGIVSTRASIRRTAAPQPSAEAVGYDDEGVEYDDEGDPIIPDSEPTPEPTPEPVGSFRNKYADKFTDGEVIRTDNTYQSANLNITFQKRYFDELMSRVYYADIYIADISCLKTVLAEDTFGRGYKEWITKAARRMGSVVTMNGDYYGSRDFGVVVRNGTLYRDAKNIRDVAVLYWDGSFETLPPERFNAKKAMEAGAYQCWHFGPRLLDDAGRAMTEFNADSHMKKRHPRSAFGYYEPGHYCFVVVDGRLDESKGVKLDGLSKVMEGLGCTAAYNLDGGQTSLLAKGDKLVNRPSGGGRSASDFIIVVDEVS
jgi:exopolysaccharide biosynthesis protein